MDEERVNQKKSAIDYDLYRWYTLLQEGGSIMASILIRENRYSGKYVVIKDYKDSAVISHGDDPVVAYKEALKKGFTDPVIIYIPTAGMAQIY